MAMPSATTIGNSTEISRRHESGIITSCPRGWENPLFKAVATDSPIIGALPTIFAASLVTGGEKTQERKRERKRDRSDIDEVGRLDSGSGLLGTATAELSSEADCESQIPVPYKIPVLLQRCDAAHGG